MEVTPWEAISTLLGLALAVALWIARKLSKDIEKNAGDTEGLRVRMDDVVSEASDQREMLRHRMDDISRDVAKRDGKVHTRISEFEVKAHETFATKSELEKSVERMDKRLERIEAGQQELMKYLRSNGRNDRAGSR